MAVVELVVGDGSPDELVLAQAAQGGRELAPLGVEGPGHVDGQIGDLTSTGERRQDRRQDAATEPMALRGPGQVEGGDELDGVAAVDELLPGPHVDELGEHHLDLEPGSSGDLALDAGEGLVGQVPSGTIEQIDHVGWDKNGRRCRRPVDAVQVPGRATPPRSMSRSLRSHDPEPRTPL